MDEAQTPNFEQCLTIANQIHSGQKDKAGEPYILHPMRVALSFCVPGMRCAGILHDVLEDARLIDELFLTGLCDQIRWAGGGLVLHTVKMLTKSPREDYTEYITRVATFLPAVQVKLADLADNLSEERHRKTSYKLPDHLHLKYVWARWYLERALIQANAGPHGHVENSPTQRFDVSTG